MAEESKKEKWQNYLAISTIIIAVCATLSTFKGGGFSTKSLMNQSKAANQWSYFQSKSIKLYLYTMQLENIKLLKHNTNNAGTSDAEFEKTIKKYEDNIARYEKEKEEIKALATTLEKERDENKLHSERFGIAVIFLQIAILLSSISALMKKKYIWIISMAIGIVGVVYFFNGFWVFF